MIFAHRKTFVVSHAYVSVTLAGRVVFGLVESIYADTFCVLVDIVVCFCLVLAALVSTVFSIQAQKHARALVIVFAVW